MWPKLFRDKYTQCQAIIVLNNCNNYTIYRYIIMFKIFILLFFLTFLKEINTFCVNIQKYKYNLYILEFSHIHLFQKSLFKEKQ